uniref:Uncharacterized protein n=1 Tax=Solanum tuberosum TaxID=4113 RepID=Q0KIK7_SOLTU|nr:hypothetical protein STB1_54t00005 [Solanum tuberosum]
MKKWGINGKGWCPWHSERRGAPDHKAQKGPAGALLGAPPQGLDFRVPFGGRYAPPLFPENSTFLPPLSNSKPP